MDLSVTRRTTLSLFALTGLEMNLEEVFTNTNSNSDVLVDINRDSWPAYHYEPCNTGSASRMNFGGELSNKWKKDLNDPTGSLGDQLSPLIRYNNKLFYCTGSAIIARGSADGSVVWKKETQSGNSTGTTPIISNDMLFTAEATLAARDTETGDLIWDTSIGSTSDAPLNADDNAVYISLSNGNVKAYEKNTGNELWSTFVSGDIDSSIAVCNGTVFVANVRGAVYAIEDGERIWSTDISSPVKAAPAVVDNELYVGGIDLPLTILDTETGDRLWEHTELNRVEFTPRLRGDVCVVGNKRGEIFGINISDQETVWSESLNEGVSTAPILVDETLVVATDQGRVIGLNYTSGDRKWTLDLFDDDIVGVVASNDAVYAAGRDGNLGGAHVDGTLAPRAKVQELVENITTAKNDDVDTTQAENHLSTASEALADQDYDTAQEEAEAGIDELQPHIASREDASQRIDELSTDLEEHSSIDLTESEELLAEAQDAFQSGEFQNAESLASEGLQKLTDTVTTAETAQESIQKLNTKISETDSNIETVDFETEYDAAQNNFDDGNYTVAQDTAETALEELQNKSDARHTINELESGLADNDSLVLSESRDLLVDAEEEFDNDNFSSAVSTANDGLEEMEATVETAQSAQTSIQQLDETISDFRGTIEVSEFESESQLAQEAYANGEYEEANKTAEEAFSQLQDKHTAWEAINNAEGVSRHFAADPVAELYGYSELIESAQAAYDEGDYIQAQEEGNNARYAYWLARVTVEGTVGTGLIAGTLYIRYPQRFASLGSNIKEIYNK